MKRCNFQLSHHTPVHPFPFCPDRFQKFPVITEELGKPVHSDEKNEKTTYVTLKGLEKATRDVEAISQEALELLSGLGRENPYLTQLIQELIHRKK